MIVRAIEPEGGVRERIWDSLTSFEAPDSLSEVSTAVTT